MTIMCGKYQPRLRAMCTQEARFILETVGCGHQGPVAVCGRHATAELTAVADHAEISHQTHVTVHVAVQLWGSSRRYCGKPTPDGKVKCLFADGHKGGHANDGTWWMDAPPMCGEPMPGRDGDTCRRAAGHHYYHWNGDATWTDPCSAECVFGIGHAGLHSFEIAQRCLAHGDLAVCEYESTHSGLHSYERA